MSALAEAVREALMGVYDPCSVGAGTPLSIVDMGLVTGVEEDGEGHVCVSIRTTSPMCDLMAPILEAAEQTVLRVPGVASATVTVDTTSAWWTEADLSAKGREALHAARQRRRLIHKVEPLEWTRHHLAPHDPEHAQTHEP